MACIGGSKYPESGHSRPGVWIPSRRLIPTLAGRQSYVCNWHNEAAGGHTKANGKASGKKKGKDCRQPWGPAASFFARPLTEDLTAVVWARAGTPAGGAHPPWSYTNGRSAGLCCKQSTVVASLKLLPLVIAVGLFTLPDEGVVRSGTGVW